nr:OmpA family protein [Saprospiraceae bacterium]
MRIMLLLFFFIPINLTAQTTVKNKYFHHTEFSFMVLFDTDKHETARIPVDEISKLHILSVKDPEGRIQLEARTDDRAGVKYNLALAKRRLDFVKSILLSEGFSANRFEEYVFGKANPLRENTTDEGRQHNRSVLVEFVERVPAVEISGRVISDKDHSGMEGILYTGSRYAQDSVVTDKEGNFKITVPQGKIISLEFYSAEHVMERKFFNLTSEVHNVKELRVNPIEPGLVFNFENILFVSNQAVLLPEYQFSLPRLLTMVKLAKDYQLEIQGHVNFPRRPPQHKGTFFYDLSERRAKLVYNYLVNNGVESSRLVWKGYSNYNMIYPNATSEMHMKQNRRVSVKVLGKIQNPR